jgi:cytoskeletal protein RodZ
MSIYKDERGDTVSSAETQKVVEATPVQARQGLLGRPVLMVLIGGLVLAAIAWAIAGMYGEAVDNDAATETKKTTTTDTKAVVTPTDQKVIDNTPPAGESMQSAPTDRDPTAESGTGGGSQSVAPAGTEKSQ